jgi:hypothetical protein
MFDILCALSYYLKKGGRISRKASDGPFKSFSPEDAETFLYKKNEGNDKIWKIVSNGLPIPDGTTMSALASNRKVPGEFYVANNHGIIISSDSGESWKKLGAEWSNEYTPFALAVGE